ncbi:MAG: alpha/beta fold hydrolase [Betaproteobacteria bacterium]|nr:alpha/beta fold hydrolase [Betaproteobacteria bacterium]NCA16334.1 alpha/beta fold hydrolase [Betaproteobacteria bacterium]
MSAPDSIRREPFRILVPGIDTARHLFGEDLGPEQSEHAFICLPGLLETRESFKDFCLSVATEYRVFLLDWPGRGLSDRLADPREYRMSRYLEDFGLFFAHIQGRLRAGERRGGGFGLFRQTQPANIHLLGTSMGGLLAIFFARYKSEDIASVVLNDVGCLLPWTGILGLMAGIGSTAKTSNLFGGGSRQLADDMDIDPELFRAVQKPGHLDLPHQTTLHGVDFGRAFSEVPVSLLILKGGQSSILDEGSMARLSACHPRTEMVTFSEAGHPVPYSPQVCQTILRFCLAQNRPLPEALTQAAHTR